MANDVLGEYGSPITFKDSGGSAVITLQNLGFGAGRVSAAYDKGAGSKPDWGHVHACIQWADNPVAGEVAEVYVISHDGTNVPGGLGQVDAAVSVANKRNNIRSALVVVSAEAATGSVNYESNGLAHLPLRYISVMVWNASAAKNLKASSNVSVVTVTLLNPEIQ